MSIQNKKTSNPLQDTFKDLVDQHSHEVVKTCYSFVNNKEDAEDVAQEVFIEIYKSIQHFNNKSDIGTWIYRISINKSLDFLRKKNRKKRIADLKGLFLHKNRQTSTPHQDMEESERKEILHQQIALLAENQRIAIVLSQFDRLSNKKIAEIMKTSESAVESLLHRAKTNLRENLAKYFEKFP